MSADVLPPVLIKAMPPPGSSSASHHPTASWGRRQWDFARCVHCTSLVLSTMTTSASMPHQASISHATPLVTCALITIEERPGAVLPHPAVVRVRPAQVLPRHKASEARLRAKILAQLSGKLFLPCGWAMVAGRARSRTRFCPMASDLIKIHLQFSRNSLNLFKLQKFISNSILVQN
jgi:hypothetical protein